MPKRIGRKTRPKKASREPQFPADPLERSHHRWVDLFFGTFEAISKHDRRLVDRLLLAFEKAGLAAWQGDALSLTSGVVELNPSDETLARMSAFRAMVQHERAPLPSLRGRSRHGRLRPPYALILLTYYRMLFEERAAKTTLRWGKAAHERAKERAAEACGYTVAALTKHLERAQSLYPNLMKLWKGKGGEWVRST